MDEQEVARQLASRLHQEGRPRSAGGAYADHSGTAIAGNGNSINHYYGGPMGPGGPGASDKPGPWQRVWAFLFLIFFAVYIGAGLNWSAWQEHTPLLHRLWYLFEGGSPLDVLLAAAFAAVVSGIMTLALRYIWNRYKTP